MGILLFAGFLQVFSDSVNSLAVRLPSFFQTPVKAFQLSCRSYLPSL